MRFIFVKTKYIKSFIITFMRAVKIVKENMLETILSALLIYLLIVTLILIA